MLTERESQIMAILWQAKEATADDVRRQLGDDSHDSTVRTLLRVLVRKRYARASRRQRPTVYQPAVARAQVQQQAARGFLQRFFSGSAESLVLRLLEDEELTPQQLEQLKKSHARRKRKRGKP
jgi:predicted transcriptional regulator